MKHLLVRLFFLALITPSGCSLFSSENAVQTPNSEEAREASPDSTQPSAKKIKGLEITWEVPGEPVDGFVIRYGESRGALSKEVKVTLAELREESDSEYGPVFRYFLKDAPQTSSVFVSIAAFKGDRISNFSEVLAER